jgi:signal transduction histidine kinase
MLLSIDKLVISKLLTLTSIMTKVKNTGDLNQTIPNLGGGEIGLLAQSFKEMLYEVEKLRKASFHNEKMASLGEMAGGIAHEINNPITIITGSTHLMKKMIEKGINDPDKLLKQVEDINKTILRISKIVSGLKNLSRDSQEEEFSKCSLMDVVADALSVCSEKFKMKGIEILYDMNDPVFLTQLSCLRVQLSQVIFNLMGNAYDAIEKMDNPWVKISANVKDNILELRFKDSGTGIPLEIQNKIFQPFYTTKEIGKGTGLGLSLSNTIIKRHNGEFFIDNESKNTCFVIKIPLLGPTNEL